VTFHVISLGWGVQSFALAAMSALGELPPVAAAVHADTGWERSETVAFAERWTPWLEQRGVQVVTVNPRKVGPFDRYGSLMLPVRMIEHELGPFTAYLDGKALGMLARQCTGAWKIAPIRRWLQANRDGQRVQQWLGITLDEYTRMRDSDVKYIENAYPFIQQLDAPRTPGQRFAFRPDPMMRGDVVRWLVDHGLEVPVKSGCVMCPYHDRATWREIQQAGNGDWQRALDVDNAIRDKRPGYVCYLTAERRPLAECDFSSQEDHGQLTLWDEAECSGHCFL